MCDRRLDREVDAKLVAGLHGVVAGIGDMSGGRIEQRAGEDRRLLGERMAEVILRAEVVLAVRIPDFVPVRRIKDAIATNGLRLSPWVAYGAPKETGEWSPEPSSLDWGPSSAGIVCGWNGEYGSADALATIAGGGRAGGVSKATRRKAYEMIRRSERPYLFSVPLISTKTYLCHTPFPRRSAPEHPHRGPRDTPPNLPVHAPVSPTFPDPVSTAGRHSSPTRAADPPSAPTSSDKKSRTCTRISR